MFVHKVFLRHDQMVCGVVCITNARLAFLPRRKKVLAFTCFFWVTSKVDNVTISKDISLPFPSFNANKRAKTIL